MPTRPPSLEEIHRADFVLFESTFFAPLMFIFQVAQNYISIIFFPLLDLKIATCQTVVEVLGFFPSQFHRSNFFRISSKKVNVNSDFFANSE